MPPSNPILFSFPLLYLTDSFVGTGIFAFKHYPSVLNTRHRVAILTRKFSCDPGWSRALLLLPWLPVIIPFCYFGRQSFSLSYTLTFPTRRPLHSHYPFLSGGHTALQTHTDLAPYGVI
ncbi:hypothetical protein EDB87DRAFT_1657396 [Lactarius vividus]|nr:hypothetical protein EDB87DRAFT_1657396 [Lactarius vividus]